MKMMKNSFVRRAVLLLTFTMLFLLITANVILAEDAPLTLTLSFNPDECTVLLESDLLPEPVKMENGVAVEIPYGADVKVTVTPKMGYRLLDIKNTETGLSIKQPNLPVYQEGSFLSSLSGQILCETSIFDVVFEIGEVLYKPVSENMADLTGLKYHYMQAENLTNLPAVKRAGYEFKCWQVIKSDGTEVHTFPENQTYIPAEIINQDMVDTGRIYLHAVFAPLGQNVIRHDKAYDAQNGIVINHLGTYNAGQLPMDSYANALTQMGDDGASDDPQNPYLNYKSYVGYKLYTLESVYQTKRITIPPVEGDNPNTFERYYTPIVYKLVYDLDGGTLPENAPLYYTYDAHTPIKQPTRRGFTFGGWQVKVDDQIVDERTSPDFVLGNQGADNAKYAAETEEIHLTALWYANTYNITYDWNVPAELIDSMNEWNAALPKSFTFNQADFFITNPVRKGYTFTGWVLRYTNSNQVFDADTSGLTALDGKYQLDCTAHTENITLTASWQVKTYNVILSAPDATGNNFTASIPGVQYDAALVIPEGFIVPTRTGYTFVGYYDANGNKKYINADGTAVEGLWDLDSTDGTVTLVAKWDINFYEVIIEPLQKVPAGVEITIIEVATGMEHPYTGDPISLPYQTEFKVKIKLPKGFKITEWNGVRFETDDVHDGEIFISDPIQLGAEPISLRAEACPAMPEVGTGKDIQSIIVESDTSIKVNFADPTVASRYQVAISTNPNDANLTASDWQQIIEGNSYYLFTQLASGEELTPGTVYYVFIRLKETGSTNSGLPAVEEIRTQYDAFVNQTIQDLNNMFVEGDGDITQAVIIDTVKKIEALRNTYPLPDDFYEQIQALVDEMEAKLAFARFQDSKIAALNAFLDDCLQSGSFNTANIEKLDLICIGAVGDISAATTKEDVEAIFATAMAKMKEVPVSYLYDAAGTIQLSTLLGLGQNGGISLSSIEDIRALRRAVSDAIAQGKITADSFITIEEAKELLRVLDTVSAYNFYLINVQPAQGDSFVFRMLIPEALAGRTGLQVAYYNAATGMVELLETTVEGNTLIFRAKQVADFVILADPTVDLTGVIIALGVIVLCQLIAIILVLAARSKAKNAVKHASVALPMFLTIYFQPANSEMIALGLGALALILQIVLMWLLISSGMIRVRKAKKPAPTRQKPAPSKQTLQSEAAAVPAQEAQSSVGSFVMEEEEPEEEYAEDEQVLGEDVFDEVLANELAREQAEDELADEIYDDEEFIEHAPNPYYSLDDEENVYAYNQEETERVSNVDTTGSETEETSYGADPIDGVFGEAYVQDGYSGDEGGDSYYAESDAGEYDYADEAFAAQFDSENLEGEETSDEGSVDPAAYIVNDNEEYSEEEEMYRYDE